MEMGNGKLLKYLNQSIVYRVVEIVSPIYPCCNELLNMFFLIPYLIVIFTASSVLSDDTSSASLLLWFGSDEGVSTQFRHIESVWASATQCNKTVVFVPFWNYVHYPDQPSPISLCELFVLPSNFICPNVTADFNRTDLMLQQSCNFYGPVTHSHRKRDPYNLFPARYGVSILPPLQKTPPPDFAQLQCVVGGSEYFITERNSRVNMLQDRDVQIRIHEVESE